MTGKHKVELTFIENPPKAAPLPKPIGRICEWNSAKFRMTPTPLPHLGHFPGRLFQ